MDVALRNFPTFMPPTIQCPMFNSAGISLFIHDISKLCMEILFANLQQHVFSRPPKSHKATLLGLYIKYFKNLFDVTLHMTSCVIAQADGFSLSTVISQNKCAGCQIEVIKTNPKWMCTAAIRGVI